MYKKLIDTHSHVLKDMYKDNFQDIVDLVISTGMKSINIAIDMPTSYECVEIAKKYPNNFYATIGIHPVDAEDIEDSKEDKIMKDLKKLYLDNEKYIVAIGESGIDIKYVKSLEKQKRLFVKHIQLARELNLPVVIHNREAFDIVLPIVKENPDVQFLMHSWTGNPEQMNEYKELDNMWFSFSGITTFNSAKYVADCLDIVPMNKILIETDCPWLTPTPHRGKENNPTYTMFVAEFIAKRLNKTTEEILDLTHKNAKSLFDI